MNPLAIPQLKWDQFRQNPAVDAAYRDLMRLTKRTVALHPRSLVPGVPESFYCAWKDAIHIFLEESCPRVHHSAVHELLHGIVVEEGYGKVAAKLPDRVQTVLSNEMQHTEMFRRMETYGLDMTEYWSHWDEQLAGFMRRLPHSWRPYNGIEHFPQVFTWFFFPKASARHLAEFRRQSPLVYQFAEEAYRDVSAIGIADAERQRQGIERFRQHWLRYCEKHEPKCPFGTEMADNIRAGSVRRLMEFESVRPAEDIIALLEREGFCVS